MHTTTRPHFICNDCIFSLACSEDENSPIRKSTSLVKQYRVLKPREVLYLPKNKFQYLYVVQKGAIKTYQTEADGHELIRGFYFAGEILGYEAISAGFYPFSAVSLCETLICEIPYSSLLKFLQNKILLQENILHSISQQLNIGVYLASSTADQRLAAFLIDLSTRLHLLNTEAEFILPMTRQDIGNYLRLTAETISRIFSRFQKRKLIKINHKKIKFLQFTSLQKIAEGL